MTLQSVCHKILLTIGEPAGIGPELVIKIAQNEFDAQLIVIGDSKYLMELASKLELPLQLIPINWQSSSVKHQPGTLYIEELPFIEKVNPGMLSSNNAKIVLQSLIKASELALEQKITAIVTAPVHKANINKIEPTFLGHTEFFAKQANIDKVVMMLATKNLRMALATTHIPLKEVSDNISQDSLFQIINVISNSFKCFNLKKPKIAVCGLNPHAGEDGLLGMEDMEIVSPAVEKLKEEGFDIEGPFPSDSLFTPQKRDIFDVFLAMYHDQGLPVVKAIGFGQTVNVTLGLPYIRTSVDHGTALDIADSFSASPSSLIYAINYTIQMAQGKLPE
ncbi:MAG: 4-hydroxythreonine-4-phosphate dehydrogenase [Polaribacter sp.]|jgi:4-hydroxythreonine-4-phosphate dehydrogenase